MAINIKQRHFLQSADWGSFQSTQNKKIVARQGEGWSYQALIGPNPGRIAKYLKCVFLPYGPTFNGSRGLKMALEDIYALARQEKADHIIVEPYNIGSDLEITPLMEGYKKLKKSRQPELTLITDLSKNWDDILATMSKTNRYQWKYLDRDKISFQKTFSDDDIDDFVEMMRQTSARTGANFPAKQYYKDLIATLGPAKKAGIIYGLHDKRRMVGTLYVDDLTAKRRYYFYAGSYDSMRQLKVSLNAALVMYLQHDAKHQGFTSLDYFGIAPQDAPPTHHWYGLSKFKRSLGGEEFATLGTWERPVNRTKVAIIKLIQRAVPR